MIYKMSKAVNNTRRKFHKPQDDVLKLHLLSDQLTKTQICI